MGKPEILPLVTSEALSRSHQVLRSWLGRGWLHLCKISSRSLKSRGVSSLYTGTWNYANSAFLIFVGSCHSPQPCPEPIFATHTSYTTRIRASRLCGFRGLKIKKIIILDPPLPKNRHFWNRFWRVNFRPKIALEWGCTKVNYLIVVIALWHLHIQ